MQYEVGYITVSLNFRIIVDNIFRITRTTQDARKVSKKRGKIEKTRS